MEKLEKPTPPVDLSKLKKIICIAGNDGTGKSSIFQKINISVRQSRFDIYCIQRSSKCYPPQLQPLKNLLKRLDQLTFIYPFQSERKQFHLPSTFTFTLNKQTQTKHQVQVCWFMLDLQPDKIRKRIDLRQQVDIYDGKKAVEYYSYIYREFAYYYGMVIVNTDCGVTNTVTTIINIADSQTTYKLITSLKIQDINLQFVQKRNLQHSIYQYFQSHQEQTNDVFENLKKQLKQSKIYEFYSLSEEFNQLFKGLESQTKQKISQFRQRLCARWLVRHGQVTQSQDKKLKIKFKSSDVQKQLSQPLSILSNELFFKIHKQGQSKILLSINSTNTDVQEYFSKKVVILLKSTIYSHTRQHTGQIPQLGSIRAIGNMLFLQMMHRNNLPHSYVSISQHGIILSQLVQTNMLQIVFKKQCLGTDKHSYQFINKQQGIINEDNTYQAGVYIRIDWRNPNHLLISQPELELNQNLFYYVVEKYFGKERFFKQFLVNKKIKALGDKVITQDLLTNYAHINKIKINALKLYTSFLYYARKVGLEILDGCFMFDKNGQIGWSEINPDCMRVKSIVDKQDYDKDIWRYGGSSSKQQIFYKWTIFNNLFISWFKQNRFHKTQLLELPQLSYPYNQICQSILKTNQFLSKQYTHYYNILSSHPHKKRLIPTIDVSKSHPILVKSSKITEIHSQGNINIAWDKISLFGNVLLVDIDAALANGNNRDVISEVVGKQRSRVMAVGGGIRNKEALEFYLNQIKVNKIIIASNLDLLDYLSAQDRATKVIVQLSLNEHNQILIKGRSQNTKVSFSQRLSLLLQKNIKTISITFSQSQGHLNSIPHSQLINLLSTIPSSISTIIIAGGISSIQDLQFIWSFKRCIPQVGSAIWKDRIRVEDVMVKMVKWDKEGLVVTSVVDQWANVVGQVYMDQMALKQTVSTRKLYRYSRQYKKVMKKGQTSDNVFNVLDIKFDCDNDSIIVVVKGQDTNKVINFCHQGKYSCFDRVTKNSNFCSLQQHILQRSLNGTGYSSKMSKNQGLLSIKLSQQLQQLQLCSTANKVHQTSDLLSHLLMYLNYHKISMNDVTKQLQKRSIQKVKIKDLFEQIEQKKIDAECQNKKKLILGVLSSKHYQRIDQETKQLIGIHIKRATDRSSKIQYQMTNQQTYNTFFEQQQLGIVGVKSKDMATILSKNLVDYCINYSIMMQNHPAVSKLIKKLPSPGITLALICNKDNVPDPKTWSPSRKGRIICEYPYSVNRHFQGLGVSENCYTLIRVNGGTESYLVGQMKQNVDYCDAIVQSGRTIKDNNLEIVKVLQQTIYVGLYKIIQLI